MLVAVLAMLFQAQDSAKTDSLFIAHGDAVRAFYSDEFNKCAENATTTARSMDCIDKETSQWEQRVESAFKRALAKLSVDSAKDLRKSQKAWHIYRAYDAAAYYNGGEAWKVNVNERRLRLTIERDLQLEDFVHDPCANPAC